MSSPGARQRSPYLQPDIFGLPSRYSLRIRMKIFDALMELAKPSERMTVLDVGPTSEQRTDTNFFEKLYPYPCMITAAGTEDCSFLEKDRLGVKFLRLSDGVRLPFPDKSFDLVVSFAAIEHVGSRRQQQEFVRELSRVGRRCCLTTPNRWHFLEFHTIMPLIHWFPPGVFRFLLRCMGHDFLAREENLNLLSLREMLKLLPGDKKIHVRRFRLFGFVSNLMFYFEDRDGI